MKFRTNYEAEQAAKAVACIRRIREMDERFQGQRVVYDDPKPGERAPPAGFVYPALIRSAIARVFDDAEQEGLDRTARVALEAWLLATATLNGHPIGGER